jgi:hypothetical protein
LSVELFIDEAMRGCLSFLPVRKRFRRKIAEKISVLMILFEMPKGFRRRTRG